MSVTSAVDRLNCAPLIAPFDAHAMLDDDLVFAQSSASSSPAHASTASLLPAASDASERVLGYAVRSKMSFTTDTGAQLKNTFVLQALVDDTKAVLRVRNLERLRSHPVAAAAPCAPTSRSAR